LLIRDAKVKDDLDLSPSGKINAAKIRPYGKYFPRIRKGFITLPLQSVNRYQLKV
jgi:hypothetical protein